MANAVVLVYLLAMFADSLLASPDCKRVSNCRCEMDNGFIMDLTTMLPDGKFLTAQKSDLTYYYHGCVDAKFDVGPEGPHDTCKGETIVACMQNLNNTSVVGRSTDAVFSVDTDGLRQLSYQLGDNKITTVITFLCTPEAKENELIIYGINDKRHDLHLFTKSACTYKVEHSLSTGSKLVIMFFVFLIVYLVGGGCISYFLRGARGREIVPHVEFWVGLPGLVKDGFVFLLNGCNPTMVSTAEAYDEI